MKTNEILLKGSTMERYNVNKLCPKCGGSMTTEYIFNRMKRQCVRCGYVCHQLPLDAKGGEMCL